MIDNLVWAESERSVIAIAKEGTYRGMIASSRDVTLGVIESTGAQVTTAPALPDWSGDGIVLDRGIPNPGEMLRVPEGFTATADLPQTFSVIETAPVPVDYRVYAVARRGYFTGLVAIPASERLIRVFPDA